MPASRPYKSVRRDRGKSLGLRLHWVGYGIKKKEESEKTGFELNIPM